MTAAPIVLTKLNAPALRAGHVTRGALVERLRAGAAGARLVAVIAPAGWGKTTLLAEWSAGEDGASFAWVALEAADNDAARAFGYVAEALRRAGAPVGDDVQALLAAPGGQGVEAALGALVNALTAWEGRAVVVLDDLHVIRDPRVLEGIAFLIDHLPPSVRLAVTSRTDPPVRLGRLRARGELLEIRADELRFAEGETARLLAGAFGLDLGAGHLRSLSERTEGWAAAIVLAALSLKSRGDPDAFMADFAGTHRYVVDYLGDEVLAGQPDRRRRFLAATSILSRLCGDLCDAVLAGEAGAAGARSRTMLEELERENLLVVPLDDRREWFRYHHLFQDVLRHELARERGAGEVIALHRRAAGWWETAGEPGEAIGHLLAAGDTRDAAELVTRWWNAELQRGRIGTVLDWFDRLPPEVVAGDARLLLARGWLALDAGDLSGVERYAAGAVAAPERGPLHEGGSSVAASVTMLRATARYQAGDLRRAAGAARDALELERDPSSRWRAVGLATLGASLFWLDAASTETEALLVEAVANATPGQNSLAVLRALGARAALRLEAGDTAAARRLVTEALGVRDREHLDEYWMWSLAGTVHGRLLERDGDLDGALAAVDGACAVARRGTARIEEAYALVVLAPLQASAGDAPAATATLEAARGVLAACPDPGRTVQALDAADRAVRARAGEPSSPAEPLTERERAVLRLLATSMPLGDIAGSLFVSRNTVKTHVRGIYRKLGAAERADAVARARRTGLL